MLKAAGHPEWNPPAYALVSEEALAAWIGRAIANSKPKLTPVKPAPAPVRSTLQEPKPPAKPAPPVKIGGHTAY
jgi:hypothetical protein